MEPSERRFWPMVANKAKGSSWRPSSSICLMGNEAEGEDWL